MDRKAGGREAILFSFGEEMLRTMRKASEIVVLRAVTLKKYVVWNPIAPPARISICVFSFHNVPGRS